MDRDEIKSASFDELLLRFWFWWHGVDLARIPSASAVLAKSITGELNTD
jgi:hypothetical protein